MVSCHDMIPCREMISYVITWCHVMAWYPGMTWYHVMTRCLFVTRYHVTRWYHVRKWYRVMTWYDVTTRHKIILLHDSHVVSLYKITSCLVHRFPRMLGENARQDTKPPGPIQARAIWGKIRLPTNSRNLCGTIGQRVFRSRPVSQTFRWIAWPRRETPNSIFDPQHLGKSIKSSIIITIKLVYCA